MLFQGNKHSVRFAVALPASAARTGVQIFTVYKQQEQLKVSITSLFPNNLAKQSTNDELVLLTGVSDFSLTYFGSTELLANNKNPASWQEDWIAKKEQPRLIKISLSLTDGQFFPDMIINLRVVKSPIQSNNPPAL